MFYGNRNEKDQRAAMGTRIDVSSEYMPGKSQPSKMMPSPGPRNTQVDVGHFSLLHFEVHSWVHKTSLYLKI